MATVGEEQPPTSNGVNGHPSPTSAPPDALAERDLNQKSPSLNDKSDSALESSRLKNQDAFVANQSAADESLDAATTPSDPKPQPPTPSMPDPGEKSSAAAEDTQMSDAPEAQPTKEKSPDGAPRKEDSTEQTPLPKDNTKDDDVTMGGSKDDADAERPEQAPKEVEPADVDMAGADETLPDTAPVQVPDTKPTESAGGDAPSMSNLAIAETQDSNSAPTTADTSMADVASQPAKVAREREEDDAEERSAKRAKTEDAAAAEVPTEPAKPVENEVEVAPAVESVASSLSDEHVPPPRERPITENSINDPAMEHKPMTKYLSQQIRHALAQAKKTKASWFFRVPVTKSHPTLADAYRAKVPEPMDITKLEETLRQWEANYQNLGEVVNHIFLLYENAVRFNGRSHEVTVAGKGLVDNLFTRLSQYPAEEPPVKTSNKAASSRQSESRAAPRRESRAPAAAAAPPPQPEVVVDTSAATVAFPAGGTPIIRRDSTKVDNERPKRPVQPPKNRDLPYVAKNSKKKKAQPEMRFCKIVLDELLKAKNGLSNQWFTSAVDPVAQNLPTYHKVIKRPMDLGKMQDKLDQGDYNTAKDFEGDFKLIVSNCYRFNGEPTVSVVSAAAKDLNDKFFAKWQEKDKWVADHTPHAAPASASSPGDGDDSDDDAEASEPEAEIEAGPVNSGTLTALEARLAEENQRLNQLLGAKVPDKTSVNLQQNMINMVTNEIITEKMRLAEEESKNKKSSKSKPSKSKKGGAAAPAPAKKAGGSSGAKRGAATSGRRGTKARVMGQAEKDIVSENINELDESAMDKAIDIIKKDTRQEETETGELELDIDQLSSDALGKIYDLILKSLPKVREKIQKAKPSLPSPPAPDAPAKSNKSKKHKPMGKAEQERKLEELREIKAKFQRTGSGSQEPMPSVEDRQPAQEEEEEEDDSDSEEE